MTPADETRRLQTVALGAAAALALVLLGAAVAIDRAYFANAITVSWRQQDPNAQDANHRDFEVVRTVEHRISFSHSHRPVARYIQGWRYDRLPPPMSPPIDAMVIAHLQIPPGPNRFVDAEGSGRRVVTVDGAPVPLEGLPPGDHWVEVWWQDRNPSRNTRFELVWGRSRNALDPIPREHLTSAVGAWPDSRKVYWAIALVLTLGASLLLGRALLVTDVARRHRLELLATLTILALALGYRFFDYDVMPQYLENGDELFALWNGWSILHDGTPRGWTLWPGSYGGQPITMTLISMHGVEWHVIEPYFEHPPLLHVLVGAAAMLGGADDWSHARLMHGRLVPIFLSTLSTWLVIVLSRRLDGRRTSTRLAPYFAGLFYAVLPTIAVQGRVIKEEAILTPLILGAVLSFFRWRDEGRKTRDVVIAAVLAGACMLAKVTGLAVVAALVMLFAFERAHKEGLRAGLIGAAVASLFPIFGAVINWQVFVETQRLQGGRPTHFNLFLRFFDDGMINMTLIGRGWLLFLWLATAATALARPRRDLAALYMVPLFYLTAIGLGSGNWTYGWYISPVVPFLCVGVGRFLADLWESPEFVRGWLFSLTGVMYGFNFVLDPDFAKQGGNWPEIRREVTVLLALQLTPYALVTAYPRLRPYARAMTALWVAAVVALSGWFIANYETFYDIYRDFDRDAYFDR
jgi:4-amino-4-deoxy-L-arabinose transferase-like glycosyltransferase